MNILKFNIIANSVGRIWSTIISIAVVPLYIKILGIESYGLIGFFTTLQMFLSLLDLGLGGTMNREMARYSANVNKDKSQEIKDLVRTLEILYWSVGIFIGIMIWVLSPFLATHWLKAESLSAETLQKTVMFMGLAISLQWPLSLYSGGLMGLQKQVLWNSISITMATLRSVGGILILWFVSPTIQMLFSWFIFASAFHTGLTSFILWKNLPGSTLRGSFKPKILKEILPYAASLSFTTVTMIILGQLDKLLLSTVLPLSTYGYYMLASTVAAALAIPPSPISDALFPRYVQLVEQKDEIKLKIMFHKGCQLISGLIIPAAMLLALFSSEILFLWTGNKEVALKTHTVTSLLVLGVLFNTMMGTLDNLQMAFGWLKPAFFSRLTALILLGPLMIFMGFRYGAVGAAIVWLIIYIGYFLITPHFVYNHLLKTEKWRWYFQDFVLPFTLAFITAWLWRVAVPFPEKKILGLAYLGMGFGMTFMMTALSLPFYRNLTQNLLQKNLVKMAKWPLMKKL